MVQHWSLRPVPHSSWSRASVPTTTLAICAASDHVLLVIQECDILDCYKCLCSSYYTTVDACYTPCHNASSGSDLVYGVPARDGVMEAMSVQVALRMLNVR